MSDPRGGSGEAEARARESEKPPVGRAPPKASDLTTLSFSPFIRVLLFPSSHCLFALRPLLWQRLEARFYAAASRCSGAGGFSIESQAPPLRNVVEFFSQKAEFCVTVLLKMASIVAS